MLIPSRRQPKAARGLLRPTGAGGRSWFLTALLKCVVKIGIGPVNETAEVGSQPKGDEGDQGPGRTPNAYELRLLLPKILLTN